MKDTEITVAGKCVGEYDMCPDPVMFDLPFGVDIVKSTNNEGDGIYNVYQAHVHIQNKKLINEMCERNMSLHIICDCASLNNQYATVDITIPLLKTTYTIASLSGGRNIVWRVLSPFYSKQTNAIPNYTIKIEAPLDENDELNIVGDIVAHIDYVQVSSSLVGQLPLVVKRVYASIY